MGKSLVGIPPVRKAFGIRMVSSYKLSFPTHFRNAVNYMSHSFYSLKLTEGLMEMYILFPLNFLVGQTLVTKLATSKNVRFHT